MKEWLSINPGVCFSLFAFLIAARDTFTQIFLGKSVDPVFMLFVFFVVTVSSTFLYSLSQVNVELKPLENMKEKIVLGFITCLAFVFTVYGIKFLGASIFSLIEHCLIPVSTLLLGYQMFKDKISKTMLVGILFSVISLALFIIASQNINATGIEPSAWLLGVLLAVLSSALTTVSSAFQKKLISKSYKPYEVLLIRFSIPTLFLGFLLLLSKPTIPSLQIILLLILIGFFFFTLPLLLLLQGFVRASLARFSVFNILVPAFTFVTSSILISDEFSKWSSPGVVIGIVGITAGYLVFEWNSIKPILIKSEKNK